MMEERKRKRKREKERKKRKEKWRWCSRWEDGLTEDNIVRVARRVANLKCVSVETSFFFFFFFFHYEQNTQSKSELYTVYSIYFEHRETIWNAIRFSERNTFTPIYSHVNIYTKLAQYIHTHTRNSWPTQTKKYYTRYFKWIDVRCSRRTVK